MLQRDSLDQYLERRRLFLTQHGVTGVNFMGTMGSGKSEIAKAFAARIGGHYKDADTFHTAAAKAKMGSGQALNDQDRIPFLEAIREFFRSGSAEDIAVSSCSALKTEYRAIIAGAESEALQNQRSAWNMPHPNLGLINVWIKKPFKRVLLELDRAAKNPEFARHIEEDSHYIHVTYEDHEILTRQFELLETCPPHEQEVLTLDVEKYRRNEAYDSAAMVDAIIKKLRQCHCLLGTISKNDQP